MASLDEKAAAWMDELAPFMRHAFTPARLRVGTALLVIDMQRFFIDRKGDAFLPHGLEALPRVKALVEKFREARRPVIFTRHEDRPGDRKGAMGRWWGNIMEPGDPQLEIVPELSPLPEEIVIHKHQYSAFHETGLADRLREMGVRGVVITGVMTHLCCECTARDAFMEDFDASIVVDATATSADELHVAALKTLANGFAVPLMSRQILDEPL